MKQFLLLLIALIPLEATADCKCLCVNENVRAVCSKSTDIAPVCAPRVCPPATPLVNPIPNPGVPPVGAVPPVGPLPPVGALPPIGVRLCSQEQVYNEESRKYEWRQVCN